MAIPEFILQSFLDQVLGFLAEKGRNLVSDAVTKRKIRDAISNASVRFENEYSNQELARTLNSNTKFHDLDSVRESIRHLLEHPFSPAPKVQIGFQLKSVLPVSYYDEVDAAASFFLERLQEELMGIEKLHSILLLIYGKRTADATERTALGVEKLVVLQEKSSQSKKPRDKKVSVYSAQTSSPSAKARQNFRNEVLPISKNAQKKNSKGFVYGRPVYPEEFLSRESEILTIFNRLRNRESTAITGERRSGKTSLLLKLADHTTQEYFLKDDSKKIITSFFDLQVINSEYDRSIFWGEALEPLQGKPGHASTVLQLNYARDQGYSNSALRKLFTYIAERGYTLVLLLDEYDRFFGHPNFRDPSFFAGLRSLSTITGGLVIITTSKLTVNQMNIKGKELFEGSVDTSPLFNNFIELKLRPFDDDAVVQLLQSIPNDFTSQEKSFIRRIAGRYPFMLQAMAATLLETSAVGEERQTRSAEIFYQRFNYYFDALWRNLDDKAKTTSVILSLMDLGRYSNVGSFSFGEIMNQDTFEIELMNLSDFGLVEKSKTGWTISAQAFTWWIRDVVISKNRESKEQDDWLVSKRYSWILTEQQWDELIKLVKMAPEYLTKSVTSLAESVAQELTGAK